MDKFNSINDSEEVDDNNFKVLVRVRPLLPREILNGGCFSIVDVKKNNKVLHIYEHMNFDAFGFDEIREQLQNPKYYQIHQFTYDHVFNEKSKQQEVYEVAAKKAIASTLKGYNSTILAYGQTGTGKTFTMEGKSGQKDGRGIIPRSILEIFRQIDERNDGTVKSIKVSYLQIYNEQITDLLAKDKTYLHIREDRKRGIFVDGLKEWPVDSPQQILKMMKRGAQSRPTASTKMNEMSSRSHAIFIVTIERTERQEGMSTHSIGKINFVDLAGSERIRVTGATGQRLEECKKINRSLAALGNVISALSTKQTRGHIPYRNSKLTRLLEDSLGGNCKTTMIAMISPAIESFNESLSTLKFASRAKKIKNTPCINGEVEYDPQVLLRKYEEELKNLKSKMTDKQVLQPSLKIAQNRQPSRQGEDSNQKVSQKIEGSSQVEKYKGLLLKQRDIMIALTARLNNRDETIIHLQREMEVLTKANSDLQSRITSQVEQINKLSFKLKKSALGANNLSYGEDQEYSEEVKGTSTNIKKGLDSVISALTRDNGAIDLHEIAQRLLSLQKQAHKMDESINPVDSEAKSNNHSQYSKSRSRQNPFRQSQDDSFSRIENGDHRIY